MLVVREVLSSRRSGPLDCGNPFYKTVQYIVELGREL